MKQRERQELEALRMTLIDSITWSSDLGALRRLAVAMQEIGGFGTTKKSNDASFHLEDEEGWKDLVEKGRDEFAAGKCATIEEFEETSKSWA